MKTSRFDDLKKIYLLKTLAELGSLNKTAQAHKVTASAISQAIKTLEGNLGYPVITRQDEVWKLTEKGHELISQTQKIFSALTETFANDTVEKLEIGSLAIGCYESIALELMPQFCQEIRKDFPEIKLSIQTDRTSELIKKIHSGELCSAIVTQTDELPTSFLKEVIFADELGLYVSSKSKMRSLEDIKNVLFGIIAPGQDGQPSFVKNFLKQIENLKPNLVCDSFEVLKSLVENGEAVVLLPKRLAKKSAVQLIEIKIPNQSNTGHHDILLIASGTCDQREFSYLNKLLSKKN